MCKTNLYGDDSCPSQLQSWLELRGKGMVSYMFAPQVREERTVRICLYVHVHNVCVALPMIVGAWSMAVVLWQLLE